jgi:hypothetical protein
MPPSDARAAIERFLSASSQPVALEPGEPQVALIAGNYSIELRNGRLVFQAWDEHRNFSRRVTGVRQEKPGKLELVIERFGKREGRLLLLDMARPSNRDASRRSERLVFRELFRQFLSREFPAWNIAELSAEADLEHSLSPAYPRALLRKGSSAAWAALAAAAGDAGGALSFGLIWLDYLRRREPRLAIEGLALLLPIAEVRATCLRLLFLNDRLAQFAVFGYSEDGYAERLDPRDHGNLDTTLAVCHSAASQLELKWMDSLRRHPEVEAVTKGDGSLSLRVRGLEFASVKNGQLFFGIDQRTAAGESSLREIEALARELARLRSPEAADRENPLYRRHAESWLESQVRRHLEQVDATLAPAPVYGQVPAFAGGERGVMDLLAVDRSGRLAVLELKASEDVHLPLQGLDYWMRVAWHAGRDEFSARGYFPGIQLRREAPRLLFIAPALEFHPTTETILRFFAPGVHVERIGLGVEWKKQVKVMFRALGSAKPD